jgi:hypothetical protein
MFPYTTLIDSFLENKNNFTNTTLYTLSYIKSDWVKKVEDKKIKDIVSIFGTSETSGPIFLNKVSYKDFTPNTYKKVDDLYGISIESDNLLVTMPIYNYTTETGDSFQSLGDNYIYLGRNNLVRVNDVEINLARYDKLVKNFGNCDLIVDVINNALYLAIWEENSNKDIVDNINNQLRSISNNLHFISKFDYLKMQDFLTGVKVDKQLLRDYFRTR